MKQLVLFKGAAPAARSPAEFLDESIKGELLALATRVIVAVYINEKRGESHDRGDSEQDQRRTS